MYKIKPTKSQLQKAKKLRNRYRESLKQTQAVFENRYSELNYIRKNHMWMLDENIDVYKLETDDKYVLFGEGNVAFVSKDIVDNFPLNEDDLSADDYMKLIDGDKLEPDSKMKFDTAKRDGSVPTRKGGKQDNGDWSWIHNVIGVISHAGSLVGKGVSDMIKGTVTVSSFVLMIAGAGELFSLIFGIIPDAWTLAIGKALTPFTAGASLGIAMVIVASTTLAAIISSLAFVAGGSAELAEYLDNEEPIKIEGNDVNEAKTSNSLDLPEKLNNGFTHLIIGIISLALAATLGLLSKVAAKAGVTAAKTSCKIFIKIFTKSGRKILKRYYSLATLKVGGKIAKGRTKEAVKHNIDHAWKDFFKGQGAYLSGAYGMTLFAYIFGNPSKENEGILKKIADILNGFRKFIDKMDKDINNGLSVMEDKFKDVEIDLFILSDTVEELIQNTVVPIVGGFKNISKWIFSKISSILKFLENIIRATPIATEILKEIGIESKTDTAQKVYDEHAPNIKKKKDKLQKDGTGVAKARKKQGDYFHKLGDIVFDSTKAKKSKKYENVLIVKDIKTGKDYGVVKKGERQYEFFNKNKMNNKTNEQRYHIQYYDDFLNENKIMQQNENKNVENNKDYFKTFEGYVEMVKEQKKDQEVNEGFVSAAFDWSARAKSSIKLFFLGLLSGLPDKIRAYTKKDLIWTLEYGTEGLESDLSSKEQEVFKEVVEGIRKEVESGQINTYDKLYDALGRIGVGLDKVRKK